MLMPWLYRDWWRGDMADRHVAFSSVWFIPGFGLPRFFLLGSG